MRKFLTSLLLLPLAYLAADATVQRPRKTAMTDTSAVVSDTSAVRRPGKTVPADTSTFIPDTSAVRRPRKTAPADTSVLSRDTAAFKAGVPAPSDTTVAEISLGDYGTITLENITTPDAASPETSSPKYTDEYLDTLQIKKKFLINDYTLVGVQYGVNLNRMTFNPSMRQTWQFRPVNVGIMWTRYGKIFGYMPYFGIQIGMYYTQQGYSLDENYNVQGARYVTMDAVELQALAHMHFDFWKIKLIVNIGPYINYRLNIHRSGDTVLPPALVDNFLSTDHRWDYGITGGGGFAFMFDPVEIHFQVMYKYGFGLLYDPNYYSQYYYRFATDSNLIVSVGVHFQLTKRTGRTTHQLRKDATQVYLQRKYGTNEEEGQ